MTKSLAVSILTGFIACAAIALGAREHALRIEDDRNLERIAVRTQLNDCRMAYQSGGLNGLQLLVRNNLGRDKETTFVEVLNPQGVLEFSSTKTLPRGHFTVGRTILADGSVLLVGRVHDWHS